MDEQLLHLVESVATAPAQFLLASLWQGLLLTAAAWLGIAAAPAIAHRIAPSWVSGIAPRTRFLLWMIVLVLSVVIPFSTFLPAFQQGTAGQVGLVTAIQAGALTAPQIPAIWALPILGAWLLASLFSLGRLLESGWRLRSLIRGSMPLPCGRPAPELLAQLAAAAPRKVQLRLSQSVDGPVAAGFFHPVILIPDWLESKLSPAELNQIVMHELAHLERRDDWTNLLQKILCAFFPLNPALLLVERQLCREREMACDDTVLSGMTAPREYAACLTNLAEKRILRNLQSLAPGAWQRRSELAKRVHRILKHKSSAGPLGSRRSMPVVGPFVAAALCMGFVLVRCPRLIRFAPVAAAPVSASATSNVSATTLAATPDSTTPAHIVRAALLVRPARLPRLKADDVLSPSSAGEHQTISLRAVQDSASSQSVTRAAASHVSHISNNAGGSADARGLHHPKLKLFNARYAQQGKTSAKTRATRTRIVFTVWEIEPSTVSNSLNGPLAPPRVVAFSPSAGWIVFQL